MSAPAVSADEREENICRTKRLAVTFRQRFTKGSAMIDFKAVELELHNARQARIAAELACCEVEEFAAAIRQSHIVWTAQVMARRPDPRRLH
jgi:hypothetical protein